MNVRAALRLSVSLPPYLLFALILSLTFSLLLCISLSTIQLYNSNLTLPIFLPLHLLPKLQRLPTRPLSLARARTSRRIRDMASATSPKHCRAKRALSPQQRSTNRKR